MVKYCRAIDLCLVNSLQFVCSVAWAMPCNGMDGTYETHKAYIWNQHNREYGVGRGDTSYIFMLCSCRLNKCSISYWQSIMNFNTIKQQIEIKIMKNRWLYSLLLVSIIYLVLFYFNFTAYIGDYFEEEKYGFCIHCNGSVMCGTCKCAGTLLHWIVKWWRLSLLHTLWA